MRVGTRVKVTNLPKDVANDVKALLGETGFISATSDSHMGQNGYYVRFEQLKTTRRFYENELKQV